MQKRIISFPKNKVQREIFLDAISHTILYKNIYEYRYIVRDISLTM